MSILPLWRVYKGVADVSPPQDPKSQPHIDLGMAEYNNPAVRRIAELFKTCRALHRQSYPNLSLDFNRLDLTGRLTHESRAYAKGNFSDVYRGTMDNGSAVAVKMLRLPAYNSYDDKVYQTVFLRFFREINIWAALAHPNVAPCLGYTLAGGDISLVSSWHSNGNLVQFLHKSAHASEPDLILDVAEGTQYLHTCLSPLIHGDLKAANVLVNQYGIARLADFGISRQMDDMDRQTGFTTTSGVKGTMPWMAPELDEDSPLTFASDVYSCACVFLEIYCPGKTPYHYLSRQNLTRAKNAGTLPDLLQYPEFTERTALWRIMSDCWAHDPQGRPSITSVVQSLYILFELCPRVNQTVNLRPAKNSRDSQDGISAVKRLRLDSMESEPGQNALAKVETRFKRLRPQQSDSGMELLAEEGIFLPVCLSSSSSASSPPSSPTITGDRKDGLTINQLTAMGLKDVPVSNLQKGSNWHAISNPQASRTLNISLNMALAHDSAVFCVQFSPDGKYLATGCRGAAYVYDTRTGEKTHTLARRNAGGLEGSFHVKFVGFSPDCKLVATGAYDCTLRVWDLAEGKIRTSFHGHSQEVVSVTFSRDGSKIISGSLDGTCRIWNLLSVEAPVLTWIGAGIGGVHCIAISPDGSFAASGHSDRIVRIWDVFTGDLVQELEGHTGLARSVLFTPDGKTLISSSNDGTVKYWSVEPSRESQPCTATSPKRGITRRGRHAATPQRTETRSRPVTGMLEPKSDILTMATSRDGSWVVGGLANGIVGFWDVNNSRVPQLVLKGHQNCVWSVDMGPPLTPGTLGGLLATGSDDGSARIWSYDCA